MASTKKKTTTRKPTSSTKKTVSRSREMRSFEPAERTEPFMTFRITRQTIYWLIISMLILALGLWVTMLTVQVQDIYTQIEERDASTTSVQKK